MKHLILSLGIILVSASSAAAQDISSANEAAVAAGVSTGASEMAVPATEPAAADVNEYTLGPDDVVEILVRRHTEFSGKYVIDKDGKIQYRFVGDIDVNGFTKDQLQKKLVEVLSEYIVEPDVNVAILEFKSKIFYVIGEVSRPGKFYMHGNTITVRDAVVAAGLPTMAAAMRKCRITRPSEEGKPAHISVNIYEILYGGDLSNNLEMLPGDVLYVPATVMAKAMRVIAPVTTPLSTAASTGRTVISAGTMP